MAITDPAPTLWAKVQQIGASIQSHVASFLTVAKRALGWVEAETPQLEGVLNTIIAASTVFFPEASALESFLRTVESAVKWAEPMVKTAGGVIMQLQEANAIGAQVASKATPDEKYDAAFAQIKDLHPDVPDNIINMHIEPKVAQVNAEKAAAATS